MQNQAMSSSAEDPILSSIDNGLDAFGSSVKTVIYWRFKTVYNYERKDIPKKPELFSECLRSFFGERSFHVEAAIVASITDKFHLQNVMLSDSLTRALVEAKNLTRGR